MAKRYTTFSDLTGQPVDDDNDVVTLAILEHPTLEHPVQLDAARSEVEGLESTAKDYVLLELITNGGDSRQRLVLDLADFEGLIKAGEPQEVLESAERYETGPTEPGRDVEEPKRRGRPRSSGAGLVARVKGTDYTEMDNIGLVHRGRITDKEKELVAANFERAQENRRREGQPEIDLGNPKDVEKYELQALVERQSEEAPQASRADEGSRPNQPSMQPQFASQQ